MPGCRSRSRRVPLRRAAFLSLLAGLVGFAAQADTVVVPAAQDATLIEDPQGALANGSGPAIFAGRINASAQSLRRGLVLFDVASAVPPGSTIEAARLRLNLVPSNVGTATIRVHRVTQSWGEGASAALGGGGAASQPDDATWIHRFHDDVFWALPGGDFDPLAHAEGAVGAPGPYLFGPTPEMAADVQSWLDDPASNFGWMILGDEERPQTSKRFDSREADPMSGPALEIVYTPPCRAHPVGPGFWKRTCEEGLDESVASCATAALAALGLPGVGPCEAALAAAPPSCDMRAARKLAVLVMNLCSNRLQTSCPVDPETSPCRAEDVGGLLEEIAALVAAGDCRRAAACGGLDD